MSYIAKGSITLGKVSDAYTVSLSKPSCVIHADFDGTNPQLDNAQTTIKVFHGDRIVAFDCAIIESASAIQADVVTKDDGYSYTLSFTSIPSDSLEGEIFVTITTRDGYSTTVQFSYSIVREATMLDWIKDWEGSKTKVGGTYIMTPKLFIGKKDDFADYAEGGSKEQSSIMSVPGLTGVYIGPDTESTGIYGYKNSNEIFHLNSEGGSIGGWDIGALGIYSQDGNLRILSSGAIASTDTSGNRIWEIKSDGTASFAKGNVNLYADGSAEFKGSIESSNGTIGGWVISEHQIANNGLYLDLIDSAIGVSRTIYTTQESTAEVPLLENIKTAGGVAMYWNGATGWGLVGYGAGTKTNPGSQIFSLGSSNKIAGWEFDEKSLWLGSKNNTTAEYTDEGITIGSEGMRGKHWYIDNDGDISFMDGKIQFSSNSNGGNIVGWMLNDKRLSTSNVAIVSDGEYAGLYMAASDANFNSLSSSSLVEKIQSSGGIYMVVNQSEPSVGAYNINGEQVFLLTSAGNSYIASWNFDGDALFTGLKKTTAESFTSKSGYMTLSKTGIRGYRWRFEADGSGALANENITWDANGNMTINATLSADNITSGTISTANIQNESKTWYLNQDGSGALAKENIKWDTDGNITLDGTITATNCNINNATFNNVKILGSIRGSIEYLGDGIETPKTDIFATQSGSYGLQTHYSTNIGRIIRLVNYKWQGVEQTGGCNILLSDSRDYFFEDGIKKRQLNISHQCVTLLGYGDNDEFLGWIVLSRVNIMTTYSYGIPMKCLAVGKVKVASDYSITHHSHTATGDNVTVIRRSMGKYIIGFPSSFSFAQDDDVFVQVSGIGTCLPEGSTYVCKASVLEYGTTYALIGIGDDTNFADGSFSFAIYNCSDWSLM